MSETLTPRETGRGRIGTEGQPIPAPTYIVGDADSNRTTIINCALWDCREKDPHATPYRVAEWVDAYLTYWDALAAAPGGEPTVIGEDTHDHLWLRLATAADNIAEYPDLGERIRSLIAAARKERNDWQARALWAEQSAHTRAQQIAALAATGAARPAE